MTRERECGNKIAHRSKKTAENQRWAMIRAGAHPLSLQTYKCPTCGSWHVGHTKRRRGHGRKSRLFR